MPDDDEILGLYYQRRQKAQRRRENYDYKVTQELQDELRLLIPVTERDLDFDYKLRLSRGLRKLRRKLGYDRKNYLR